MLQQTGTTIEQVLEAARAAEEAGHLDEALSIYQAGLARYQPAGGAASSVLLRKIGLVYYYRGDFEVALNLFESARRVAHEADLTGHMATALNCSAAVRQAFGQLDAAQETYSQARELAVEDGNEQLVVMIDQNLAIIANIRGDSAVALLRFQSALDRYRELGDELGIARVLNNMGMVHVDLEEWDRAEAVFNEALRIGEEIADLETLATISLNRAELYTKLERFDDARACCDRAFEIFGRLETTAGLGDTYKAYGVLYRESGKLHLAEAHLGLVTELAKNTDNRLLEAEGHSEFALVHLAKGRNADALKSLNVAHKLFEGLTAQRELVDIDRQLDRLEQSYLQIVQIWGESIESKDRYTAGHCTRVADYACKLAACAGYEGRDLTWIRMGAFLHDVGKTRVDASVLNKPGPLSEGEWLEMREHTLVGDEIVAELGFPFDIRPMVRSHHERWDGKGYPDQLAGEQIPVTARILCIADVFDALTTPRSYRMAHSVSDAIIMMSNELSGYFDPNLLSKFVSAVLPKLTFEA